MEVWFQSRPVGHMSVIDPGGSTIRINRISEVEPLADYESPPSVASTDVRVETLRVAEICHELDQMEIDISGCDLFRIMRHRRIPEHAIIERDAARYVTRFRWRIIDLGDDTELYERVFDYPAFQPV